MSVALQHSIRQTGCFRSTEKWAPCSGGASALRTLPTSSWQTATTPHTGGSSVCHLVTEASRTWPTLSSPLPACATPNPGMHLGSKAKRRHHLVSTRYPVPPSRGYGLRDEAQRATRSPSPTLVRAARPRATSVRAQHRGGARLPDDLLLPEQRVRHLNARKRAVCRRRRRAARPRLRHAHDPRRRQRHPQGRRSLHRHGRSGSRRAVRR